ncbi:MAG: RNA polymerase sigma factor [Acidimicrobiales bacterium]
MHAMPTYTAFMATAEPRLRQSLIGRLGVQRGRDATLEAMVYGWKHWDRVSVMENPIGYLYRVGVTSAKPRRVLRLDPPHNEQHEPWIEPALKGSLDELTEHQRVAVVLRHGFDWTYDEIAELLEVSVSTVRNHLVRGMEKLRSRLEVSVDG